MLGFSGKNAHTVDPTTLPIFVHALQSKEAFDAAVKVWQNNSRYVMLDVANRKELLRFVFNDPACVVWLGRDQGRQDTFELVLMWDAEGDKQDVSEVYVLTTQTAGVIGDDKRVKSLLSAIAASPAVIPVRQSNPDISGRGK